MIVSQETNNTLILNKINGTQLELKDQCPLTCKTCINSIECVFNTVNCTVTCECIPGYVGETCSEIDNKFLNINFTLNSLNNSNLLNKITSANVDKTLSNMETDTNVKKHIEIDITLLNEIKTDEIIIKSTYIKHMDTDTLLTSTLPVASTEKYVKLDTTKQLNKILPGLTTTTLVVSSIGNFQTVKEKKWFDILESLNSFEFKNGDLKFIADLFEKLNFLFNDLITEKSFNKFDIYRCKIIFENMNLLDEDKFTINDALARNIFNLMNKIIELNEIEAKSESNKLKDGYYSVFKEANLYQNESSLALMKNIDFLTKFIGIKSRLRMNMKNYHVLIADMNLDQEMFPFKIETTKFNFPILENFDYSNKSLLIDSISLNETILRKRYHNNSIRVSFKIFFNREKVTTNEEKLKADEFYRQSQRPKNFFFEITDDFNSNNDMNSSFDNFISSNILSAVIYEKMNSRLNQEIMNDPNDYKFVRIQFVVDLDQLKHQTDPKYLRCVFWNFTKLEWSSNGCFVADEESGQIYTTSLFRKVCYCSHLTNFALLFDPLLGRNDYHSLFEVFFYKFLTYLTFIGLTISSICYLIIILNRFCSNHLITKSNLSADKNVASSKIKKIRERLLEKTVFISRSPQSFKNKLLGRLYTANAICLLISNVLLILVLTVKPTFNLMVCRVISALLHYFLLSAFCFSLGTAWQHFNKLVKIFDNHEYKCSNSGFKWFLFSFIYPLFFSTLGYVLEGTYHELESNTISYCWLKPPELYFLFIAPLSVLLLISLLLYIFVLVQVYSIFKESMVCLGENNSSNNNNNKETDSNVSSSYNQKKVITLLTFSFISLGLTWILGIFVVLSSHIDPSFKLFFEFLFCLFNSFHGLTLLIGNSLGQKYSNISNGSNLSNNLTKTNFSSSSESKSIKNLENGKKLSDNGLETKRSISYYFYFLFYAVVYRLRSCFKPNPKNNNPKKCPVLEFSIINYDSDGDNQNEITLPSYLSINLKDIRANEIDSIEKTDSVLQSSF